MKKSGENKSSELKKLTKEDLEIIRDEPFFRLQYIGYFICGFDTEREDIRFKDFVEIAKFHLAQEKGVLLKDPVWNKYEDEEILIEYYGSLFYKNKEAKEKFEALLDGIDTDDFEWMEEQIQKNREQFKKSNEDLEKEAKNLSFEPGED